MTLAILESPFSGDRERNINYAGLCIRDMAMRGESPYASHVIGTLGLDDSIPRERDMGIKLGFEWRRAAHSTVVYGDFGISRGMLEGIKDAVRIRNATIDPDYFMHSLIYRVFAHGPRHKASDVLLLEDPNHTRAVLENSDRHATALSASLALEALSGLTRSDLMKFQALPKLLGQR